MNDQATVSDAIHRVKTGDLKRPTKCTHLDQVNDVTLSAPGCEDCLKMGARWVHLRVCVTCGYVGCCNSSQHKHAQRHFQETGHPIAMSMESGEEWMWCYAEQEFIIPKPK